ncbi:hypothetical protein SDA16_06925 [Legionella pneumophila serogroup 1]|uniref:hypothetical protein n=1 Tax=Legionella pneumophila TaxID=446 RepID=UPI000A696375|nr:hypothetical protein [Legionella pneumophila]HCC3235837.1 hypothetical protein [Legionella pneumophila subsp. pneumophila]HAT2149819.1 hypothetical protein [Legionella pneumophila]HAU9854102.1 hypothetical protein [Legionella pneumophila]HAU9907363.1 hypothetical protein [Legionella pneumophila]HAV0028551.1 hypothetical protein [Legionella pneumophila]
MIISEKQIILLVKFLELAIDHDLTPQGYKEAVTLLNEIEKQQSEELKEIK